jgi:hypothetical protein
VNSPEQSPHAYVPNEAIRPRSPPRGCPPSRAG